MPTESVSQDSLKDEFKKPMKLNRHQAFGFHLLGSLLVAVCSAMLVFLLWYPMPFSEATGVTDIFLLLLSVDVVIGPVITLIVFNTAKKELKRDLLIVLLLQIAALCYGVHAVFVARPVYVVFNISRFELVYANDLTNDKLAKVTDERFKSLPLAGPETIAARLPDDPKSQSDILFSALAGGDDLPQLPQYYVPYSDEKMEVAKIIKPIEMLKKFNPDKAKEIDGLLQRYADNKGGIGFLPLKAKTKDLTVVLARDSGDVLEINTLTPW